jgi:hypothetical protein
MSERFSGMRRWRVGAVALAAGLALSGCGIAVKDAPTDIGAGLVAGQDTAAGFGNRFQEPDGPAKARKPRDLVAAYFTAAAGGGPMADRVRAFLTGKARDDWQTEKDPQPTVVRLDSIGSAVPAKDGGYDVKVTWRQIGSLTKFGTIDAGQLERGIQTWPFHVVEDTASPGGFRLDKKVPPGLVLSDTALRDSRWYRTNPIYFWDKSHSVLVPDVRYLPLFIEPNQRPTTIVEYLLDGPSSLVEKAVEPLPEKAQSKSVVVSTDEGLLVKFSAGAVFEKQDDVNRVIAQLRWSLANQKVILQVGDQRRDATGGASDYRRYNAVVQSSKLTFGVSEAADTKGRVVVLTEGASVPPVLRSKANANVVTAAIDRELHRAAFVRRVKGELQLWLAGSDGESTEARLDVGTAMKISRPAWIYGTDFALVAVNGDLYTADMSSGKVKPNPLFPLEHNVTQVATSPEGRRVAFVADGKAYVSTVDGTNGSVNSNRTELDQPHLDQVLSVGWTAEDRLVVFGTTGGTVQAYRLSSDGATVAPLPNLDDAALTGLAEIVAYPGQAWDDFNVVARTDNGVFEVSRTGYVQRARQQVSREFFPG